MFLIAATICAIEMISRDPNLHVIIGKYDIFAEAIVARIGPQDTVYLT